MWQAGNSCRVLVGLFCCKFTVASLVYRYLGNSPPWGNPPCLIVAVQLLRPLPRYAQPLPRYAQPAGLDPLRLGPDYLTDLAFISLFAASRSSVPKLRLWVRLPMAPFSCGACSQASLNRPLGKCTGIFYTSGLISATPPASAVPGTSNLVHSGERLGR